MAFYFHGIRFGLEIPPCTNNTIPIVYLSLELSQDFHLHIVQNVRITNMLSIIPMLKKLPNKSRPNRATTLHSKPVGTASNNELMTC